MADEKKGGGDKKSSNDGWGSLILLALILLAVILIPAVLAAGVYFALRRVLARRESLLLLFTGAVGFGFNTKQNLIEYGQWLTVLVSGDAVVHNVSRWDIPWFALLFLTLTFAGAALSLRGSRIVEMGMTRIGRKRAAYSRRWEQKWGRGAFATEDVLPTDEQKKQIQIVQPTGGLKIDPTLHSLNSDAKPGSRDFPIGIGNKGQKVMLNEREIGMHVLIFGSTGSGKSETIKAFAGALLDLGWDGIIVDLKEDTKPGGLRDWCNEYAISHSKPFQELRLSDPNSKYWFNPLAGMGPDEMRDTILSLNTFEAAYWESINKQMLGQLVNLFLDAHEVDPVKFGFPTMLELGRFLGSASLAAAAKQRAGAILTSGRGREKEDYSSLLAPNKDQQTSAVGLGTKLTGIYETQVGRVVLQPGNGRIEFDVTQGGISYVGLDSQGKPDLSKIISSALLQRLSVYSSQRATGAMGSNPAPRFVIIDEANWVNKMIVQNLLSRARSAGLCIVLATQGPGDWINPQEGDMFSVLSQNANVCIAMSQGEPKSAEMLAEYIGKQKVTEASQKLIGDEYTENGTAKMVEDYIVAPDQLRRLSIGEAIIRVGKPTTRVQYAKVLMRDPRA
jgi:energy-coupling factor transporter ATP-binding protein EcfA2